MKTERRTRNYFIPADCVHSLGCMSHSRCCRRRCAYTILHNIPSRVCIYLYVYKRIALPSQLPSEYSVAVADHIHACIEYIGACKYILNSTLFVFVPLLVFVSRAQCLCVMSKAQEIRENERSCDEHQIDGLNKNGWNTPLNVHRYIAFAID